MAADTGEAARESAGSWKKSRDLLARGTLPVFTALVSAVLIATFITSRQDEQHLQRQRDLQTKAEIANDMSESSVRLIIAAEDRTTALLRSKKSPPAATSRALANFYASSAFIRAKLEAYYSDRGLATRWKRYTNAIGAFTDLGSIPRSPTRAKKQEGLENEIRRGFGARGRPDAVLRRMDVNDLVTAQSQTAYVNDYRQLGNALIDRGAELTREALDQAGGAHPNATRRLTNERMLQGHMPRDQGPRRGSLRPRSRDQKTSSAK
jgi:hypothetical protein